MDISVCFSPGHEQIDELDSEDLEGVLPDAVPAAAVVVIVVEDGLLLLLLLIPLPHDGVCVQGRDNDERRSAFKLCPICLAYHRREGGKVKQISSLIEGEMQVQPNFNIRTYYCSSGKNLSIL